MPDPIAEIETPDPIDRDQESRSGGTLASAVYSKLRHDILCGHLSPGGKLRTEFLRDRYQVGNSPIREALNRLAADGLVVRQDQKGFRVSSVSESELRELTMTRCWLEELALREAIKTGDSAWEEAIVIAYYRLSKVNRSLSVTEPAPNPEWEQLHRAFHMALLAGPETGLVHGFCEQLNDQADRYRRLAARKSYKDRDDRQEHQALMDVCIARDTEAAVNLLHEHYMKTQHIILETISSEFDSQGTATTD